LSMPITHDNRSPTEWGGAGRSCPQVDPHVFRITALEIFRRKCSLVRLATQMPHGNGQWLKHCKRFLWPKENSHDKWLCTSYCFKAQDTSLESRHLAPFRKWRKANVLPRRQRIQHERVAPISAI
jgi:hypothetical protein